MENGLVSQEVSVINIITCFLSVQPQKDEQAHPVGRHRKVLC